VVELGNLILIKKNGSREDSHSTRNGKLPWKHEQERSHAEDHRPAGAGPADQKPISASVHVVRVVLLAFKLFYQSKIAD
jgi:hypothetical protein